VLGVVTAPRAETARLGVGAGTAATVERAWWKALSEAFGTRAAARALIAAGAPELRPDGADVRTFDDHIVFHARRPELATFLTASPDRVDVGEVRPLADPPADVVERVRAAGSTLYAVDVTAPDVRRLGLVVVKTVAPELCMLDVPHTWRFLGNRRSACPDRNPYPHPFP
jgi:ribosomal protein S12 methylthiotransferase accessory factor YcaO